MIEANRVNGCRFLVVEDEYFLAEDIAQGLKAAGVEVVGPVGEIDDALDLIEDTEQLDGAVLDLNLRGEMAFPVADALQERNVPFIFATGYDQAAIPERFSGVIRCEKPVKADKIVQVLFG